MRYIVRKPFGGPGKQTFSSGDVVDLDGRNVASLVSLRFIEPYTEPSVADATPAKPRAAAKQKD